MTEIRVRRQPSDYRIAKCRLEDVKDIDWDDTSGGVGSGLPQYFLFGYVDCDKIIEGEVAHSCIHGTSPHNIKVCILKTDNDADVYASLKDMAGPKPHRTSCRQDVVRFVREHGEISGPDLRRLLEREGHRPFNISRVLPKMEGKGELNSTRKGRAKIYRLP